MPVSGVWEVISVSDPSVNVSEKTVEVPEVDSEDRGLWFPLVSYAVVPVFSSSFQWAVGLGVQLNNCWTSVGDRARL